jgi:hypothetical protein
MLFDYCGEIEALRDFLNLHCKAKYSMRMICLLLDTVLGCLALYAFGAIKAGGDFAPLFARHARSYVRRAT